MQARAAASRDARFRGPARRRGGAAGGRGKKAGPETFPASR